ncbi:phage major capsid protein [Sphingobium boeckii]|uniref:HK97 family phage major capsid protein n=1 Tax=Sphingobium boeckii TaxID=1082345 RepID=A0A7W9EE45_9SPHN|nr:phage major capsid protein [Sphingobium boeckii]MBB5684306.1 HK97 family phage major capsid protein [Sphingobium boeckii]
MLAILAASPRHLGPMTKSERRMGRYMRDAEDHPTGKTVEELADSLRKSIDEKHKLVMKTADDALAEAKKAGGLSEETKSSTDKVLTEINTMRETLAALEQKMARKPGSDEDESKSYGAQVAGSDKFKSFQGGGYQGSARFELKGLPWGRVKAITAAQAGTAWSDRDNTVTSLPQRQMTVRDLLSVVATTSGSIDYARQTTRTNNAAVVAEGATKPTSTYVWEQVNAVVRVIAHLAKITRQAMDDAVQLQGEVDAEMRYGLAYAEEGELLTGDGTGQHLSGLVTNATAYAAPINPAGTETMIDIIRIALLQAELALYPTDGVVMNNADWAAIELTKDTAGGYIFANPQQLAGPRLWAKPVVATPAMTIDKFLVGGFKLQTLYDRMAPEVLIASENSDDFEKNLYTMRCEERVALAVKKPGALIYGDFGNV